MQKEMMEITNPDQREGSLKELVIVKDWDIQQLLEPGLDFKTAGRTDVLEIYAAEGGSDVYHSADDLVQTGVVELFLSYSFYEKSTAASGPILPRPNTALPSETTAMVFDFIV